MIYILMIMNEKLLAFVNHPAIKQSWLCEKLWGKATTTETSRFSLKKKGKNRQRFLDAELANLEEIRTCFISQISD